MNKKIDFKNYFKTQKLSVKPPLSEVKFDKSLHFKTLSYVEPSNDPDIRQISELTIAASVKLLSLFSRDILKKNGSSCDQRT